MLLRLFEALLTLGLGLGASGLRVKPTASEPLRGHKFCGSKVLSSLVRS